MKIGDCYAVFNRKRLGHLIVWIDTFHGNLVFIDVVSKDVFFINQKDFDYVSKLKRDVPIGGSNEVISFYKNIGEEGIKLLKDYSAPKISKETIYDNLL